MTTHHELRFPVTALPEDPYYVLLLDSVDVDGGASGDLRVRVGEHTPTPRGARDVPILDRTIVNMWTPPAHDDCASLDLLLELEDDALKALFGLRHVLDPDLRGRFPAPPQGQIAHLMMAEEALQRALVRLWSNR